MLNNSHKATKTLYFFSIKLKKKHLHGNIPTGKTDNVNLSQMLSESKKKGIIEFRELNEF